VWALETTSASRPYTEVTYPWPVALVLGNEALGVEGEVLDRCDELLEVPVFGYKNSLNVACTAAVVVYEILRQWGYQPAPTDPPPD
jgi:tRNA G18 (ribose-2'-O)-methylase SpoU